ncbi:unnamed protein product [Didymodactylos carnosus]|uniref:Uncharacterized protein n=1 Tax=Didymodactylos carnosus TaxID=1234261 RepID=A0A813S2N1_9BILA|nr:unnamed protein product [Didymodactylos carnosus]CAF3574054.1 unnamed protein product [Didymodactylos carnosus]
MISISPTTIQPPPTALLCLEVGFKPSYRAPVFETTITTETLMSRSDSSRQNQDHNSSFNLIQSQQRIATFSSDETVQLQVNGQLNDNYGDDDARQDPDDDTLLTTGIFYQ